MIEQFNSAQLRRGVLPSSVDRREADIKKFADWLAPGTLLDAEPCDIEAFLLCRSWNDRTTYAFISHLHAFFVWAVKQGLVEVDPTQMVDRPRIRPGLPRPVTDGELAYLVSQSEGVMKAWILLAAFQGMRCMEIAGLERSDIMSEHIRVVGKGNKERLIPLHPLAFSALVNAPVPRFGRCFKKKDGRPVSAAYVSQSINRFMRDVGVDATAHQLRHWFGTETYRNCKDILAVGDMMGHASTNATKVYAKFSNTVAIAAVQGLSLPSMN